MRKAWINHVAVTRRKGNRGKKTMTHHEAMKVASGTWPKEKAKIMRRLKRECKNRPVVKPPPKNDSIRTDTGNDVAKSD
tara:strand:- start:682 stop:918 length:237 start_codon:yes stop_codon:yes gene_type:complete